MLSESEGTSQINRKEDPTFGIVSAKLRWLAVFAGCSSAIFGVIAFGAPFLILGAVIQPRARTSGRWLMWLGAVLLSLVVPYGIGIVFSRFSWKIEIFPLFLLSTVLVCWCDLAIVMEALRSKRNPWVQGSLDWLTWIAASVLTLWSVLSGVETALAYQRMGGLRLDLILTTIGLNVVILFFDGALILQAVKNRS